jgi:predicted alpha/beta hydrolase family esterase
MKKRVFIVHGWDGSPQEGWFPWLKKELEAAGFEVQVPSMPNPSAPTIQSWVSLLKAEVGTADTNTYFVGHSIGCQTIVRYLETLSPGVRVGGAVFVAGWFTLSELETKEEKVIGKPWIETPVNFEKVKRVCPYITAIFSDNDEVVPLEENRNVFEEKLNATIVVEHGKGHFSGSDGVTELSSALETVVGMAD